MRRTVRFGLGRLAFSRLGRPLLGLRRELEEEQLLALFNFGDQDAVVRLGYPERYYDLWTGEDRSAIDVTVPAKDFVWLMRKGQVEKARKGRRKKEEKA